MKLLLTLLLLTALSLAQGPTVSQLVATWQIVSIADTMKDGSVVSPADFGPRPFRLEGNRLIITVTEGVADLGIQKSVLVCSERNKWIVASG
jgi:hypothetical protein